MLTMMPLARPLPPRAGQRTTGPSLSRLEHDPDGTLRVQSGRVETVWERAERGRLRQVRVLVLESSHRPTLAEWRTLAWGRPAHDTVDYGRPAGCASRGASNPMLRAALRAADRPEPLPRASVAKIKTAGRFCPACRRPTPCPCDRSGSRFLRS